MIPTFLITRFGPVAAKIIFFGGIVALVALALTVTYCSGRSAGKTGEVVKQQAREIKVQAQVGDANTNASAARVDDAVNLQTQAQELKDATSNATSPADARVRRGCVILRQQGRDTSGIAACRGS